MAVTIYEEDGTTPINGDTEGTSPSPAIRLDLDTSDCRPLSSAGEGQPGPEVVSSYYRCAFTFEHP